MRRVDFGANTKWRSANPKYKVGPNPLEIERTLSVITPTDTMQLKQMSIIVDNMYNNAKTESERNALDMWRMQLKQGAVDGQVKLEFLRGFYFWLLGRGSDAATKKTMWGRANAAVHNADVAAYIDQFARKRTQYALALAAMADRVPSTLNGYYLYYKYIVNGNLQRVKEGGISFWDLKQDDFLEDFDLFAKEFDGKLSSSELMRPSQDNRGPKFFGTGPGHPVPPPGPNDGGPRDPYPSTQADRATYALDDVESRNDAGDQVEQMVQGTPAKHNRYSRPGHGAGDELDPAVGGPVDDQPNVAGERDQPQPVPVVDQTALDAMLGEHFRVLGDRMAASMQGVAESVAQAGQASQQAFQRGMQGNTEAINRVAAHIENLRADRPFAEVQQAPQQAHADSDLAIQRAQEEREFRRQQKEALAQQQASMAELADIFRGLGEAADGRHRDMLERLERQAAVLEQRALTAEENEQSRAADRAQLLDLLRQMQAGQSASRQDILNGLAQLPQNPSAEQMEGAMQRALRGAFEHGLQNIGQLLGQFEAARQAQGAEQRGLLEAAQQDLQQQFAARIAVTEQEATRRLVNAEQAFNEQRRRVEELQQQNAAGQHQMDQLREAYNVLNQRGAQQAAALNQAAHAAEAEGEQRRQLQEQYAQLREHLAEQQRQQQQLPRIEHRVEQEAAPEGPREAEPPLPPFVFEPPEEIPAIPDEPEDDPMLSEIDRLFKKVQQNDAQTADEQRRLVGQLANALRSEGIAVSKGYVGKMEIPTNKWLIEIMKAMRQRKGVKAHPESKGKERAAKQVEKGAAKQAAARREQAMAKKRNE